MVEKRLIFPVMMFVIAGISFAYGTWQFFFARAALASADARMAHVLTTIETSGLATAQKQSLYTTIAAGLPSAPRTLGFDFSGSFAVQEPDDGCANDGQRSMCSALMRERASEAVIAAVCGACMPAL